MPLRDEGSESVPALVLLILHKNLDVLLRFANAYRMMEAKGEHR